VASAGKGPWFALEGAVSRKTVLGFKELLVSDLDSASLILTVVE
jgi:hypothetical protein